MISEVEIAPKQLFLIYPNSLSTFWKKYAIKSGF